MMKLVLSRTGFCQKIDRIQCADEPIFNELVFLYAVCEKHTNVVEFISSLEFKLFTLETKRILCIGGEEEVKVS